MADLLFGWGLSGGLTAALLWGLLHSGLAGHLALDVPNGRSLHARATPRVGGWGILTVWMGLVWLRVPSMSFLVPWVLLLAAVSFGGDRERLAPGVRLAAHFLAAAGLLLAEPAGRAWPVLLLALLAIVWMLNLFNFMDGADGLAGAMAFSGFLVYAVLAQRAGDAALAMAAMTLSGAAMGFLVFNLPPARVFMGDIGSVPLGFLAAALGWLGWGRGDWPLWVPFLVFSPFWFDASLTLLRRIARRERFWLPHREHCYQRLVRLGWRHGAVAWLYFGLMAGTGATALLLLPERSRLGWWALSCWLAVFAALAYWLACRWAAQGEAGR